MNHVPAPVVVRRGGRARTVIAASLLALAAAWLPGSASAAPFDPTKVDVGLEGVQGGYDRPILVTNAGDGLGRLFVVEQTGYIRIITKAGTKVTAPFLDIHTRVQCCGEQGLLGLAFHPGYEVNGKFYVYYIRTGDGASVVDEYRVSANQNVASASTRRQVLVVGQPPNFGNHKGGNLAFGPDGFLYIGLGDGGGGGDPLNSGQNLNSPLGKILRIDVSGTSAGKQYRIPSSNPYVGKAGLDEIWSYGLRNPWRWSFDRLTGDLWIGDVGQGSWEEIDRATKTSGGGRGVNFGWDDMEGRHCFEPPSGCLQGGRQLPIAEYPTPTNPCGAVTGGFVYRGLRYPFLRGGYIFADYCTGTMWAFRADAASPVNETVIAQTGLNISSFGEDEDGELYVVDLGGTVYRLIERTRAGVVVHR